VVVKTLVKCKLLDLDFIGSLIFEIADVYDFGLGFISSLPNKFGIKGFFDVDFIGNSQKQSTLFVAAAIGVIVVCGCVLELCISNGFFFYSIKA
jgi:hypothetical protein